MLSNKCLDCGQYGMSLKSIAGKHLAGYWEAILGNHRCYRYLWLLALVIF